MAGRRTSLASLAGAKVDEVPGKSDPLLLTLPLNKLVATRFNPRRNFGTEEDLHAFGRILAKQQLQPAVVVSKAAYLKLWPEEADEVGEATYVVANGERRLRASSVVGRPTLEVVLREEIAATKASFLDAVLSENNDREDLDPIERALGIETMVQQLGGADQVAIHYSKSKGWVSQQRSLLKLTPELQALVSSGDLPVRIGRSLAGLPPADQEAAWKQELERRQEAKAAPRARTLRPAAGEQAATPAPDTPRPQASPPAAQDAERFTAVNRDAPLGQQPRSEPTTESAASNSDRRTTDSVDAEWATDQTFKEALPGGQKLPEQRPDSTANGAPTAAVAQGSASPLTATAVATAGPAADVPYGAALADRILVQLTPEQRSAFLHRYFHISSGVEQVAADMKGNLSPEDVAALADVLSEVSALMKKTA